MFPMCPEHEVDKRIAETWMYIKSANDSQNIHLERLKGTPGFLIYFLTRGTEGARMESFLHFLIYNMKRVINIMGTDRLIRLLQR